MPSLIVALQLGCAESQMARTGPGIAEATGAQEDRVQARQLLNLPATPNTLHCFYSLGFGPNKGQKTELNTFQNTHVHGVR